MSIRNNGNDDSSILQNQFTAYLMTAVKNRKITFIRNRSRIRQHELSWELFDEVLTEKEDMPWISLTPLEQLENAYLCHALRRLKDRERYIFLAKALDERTISEIALELGMSYGAVAMSYHRTVERIKKLMGGRKE